MFHAVFFKKPTAHAESLDVEASTSSDFGVFCHELDRRLMPHWAQVNDGQGLGEV